MQPSSPTATASDGSAATPQSSQAAPRLSNLAQRILVALVALPVLVAAIWFGDPWYTLLVLVAATLGVWEFNRLAAAAQGDPFSLLIFASVMVFLVDARAGGRVLPLTLTGTLLLALAWSVVRFQQKGAAMGWLWSMGGALYLGWLLSHYLGLRGLEQGREWVFLALFATFVNDTASYGVGRAFGKHRLAPRISPGKTWEGALGGLAATALAMPQLGLMLGLPVSWGFWVLGLSVSLAAQTGDLAESMLKRVAGVKEASALVPGHGGVLDRMDSLVFVGPLVYYYALWVAAAQ